MLLLHFYFVLALTKRTDLIMLTALKAMDTDRYELTLISMMYM